MVLHAKMSIFTSTKTQLRVCRRWNPFAKWTEEKRISIRDPSRERGQREEKGEKVTFKLLIGKNIFWRI